MLVLELNARPFKSAYHLRKQVDVIISLGLTLNPTAVPTTATLNMEKEKLP